MGLDLSHGCWHGAYSAFARWRHEVAGAAGYLIASVNYDNDYTADCIMIDWGHLGTPERLKGEWDIAPDDPLLYLIVHDDTKGVIHPEQGKPLADRLEELLPLLVESGDGGGHIGNYAEKTRRFIDGLRDAVSKNEDVYFH